MNKLFYLFALIVSALLKWVAVVAEYVDTNRSLEALLYGEPHTVIDLEDFHSGDNKDNPEHSKGGVPCVTQKLPKDNFGYQHILEDATKAKLGNNHDGYETKTQEAKTASKKQKRAAISFLQNQASSVGESRIEYGKAEGQSKEKSEEFEEEFNLLISELVNVNAKSTIFNRLTEEIIADYKEKIALNALRSGRTSISFNISFSNDEDSLDMICDSFTFSLQKFYDTEKSDFRKGYFESYLINENLDKYELSKPGEQLTIEQKVERRRNQCNSDAYLQDLGRGKSDEFQFERVKKETDQGFQQTPTLPQAPLVKSSGNSCPPCEANVKGTYYNNGMDTETFNNQGLNENNPVIAQPLLHPADPVYRSYRHLDDPGHGTSTDTRVQQEQGVEKNADPETQEKQNGPTDPDPQTQKQQVVATGSETEQKPEGTVAAELEAEEKPEEAVAAELETEEEPEETVAAELETEKKTEEAGATELEPEQKPEQALPAEPDAKQKQEQTGTTGLETKKKTEETVTTELETEEKPEQALPVEPGTQQKPEQALPVEPGTKQKPEQALPVEPHTKQKQEQTGATGLETKQKPEETVTTELETKQKPKQTAREGSQQPPHIPIPPRRSTTKTENNQDVNAKQDTKKLLVKIKDLESKLEEKKTSLKNFVLECNKPNKKNYKEDEIKKLIEEAETNSSQQQLRLESSTNVQGDNTFSKLKAINTVMTKIEKSIVDGDMLQCQLNKYLLNKIISMSGSILFTLSASVLIMIVVVLVL